MLKQSFVLITYLSSQLSFGWLSVFLLLLLLRHLPSRRLGNPCRGYKNSLFRPRKVKLQTGLIFSNFSLLYSYYVIFCFLNELFLKRNKYKDSIVLRDKSKLKVFIENDTFFQNSIKIPCPFYAFSHLCYKINENLRKNLLNNEYPMLNKVIFIKIKK